MKFSTRQDIEAPIDFVFERATDFDGFQRQALRRGVEIERADDLPATAEGMRWNAEFMFRGKNRRIQAELAKLDPPNLLLIQSVSGGLEADFEVEFMALARNRTRVRVGLELAPKTISARLLVQSLKLAKHRLNERFAHRVAQFARETEHRANSGAARQAGL